MGFYLSSKFLLLPVDPLGEEAAIGTFGINNCLCNYTLVCMVNGNPNMSAFDIK